ncbi:MAG: hypothetical protein V3U07_09905 [Nitrospirales bacterium]|jgi:hypothetical protein
MPGEDDAVLPEEVALRCGKFVEEMRRVQSTASGHDEIQRPIGQLAF